MSLEGERLIDTWIVAPTATKNLFEWTQTFFVSHAGFASIKIEWLSFCSKSRGIFLEWRREDEASYELVPSSWLFDAMHNIFEYAEPILTFRINRYLSNHVLLDSVLVESAINRLGSASDASPRRSGPSRPSNESASKGCLNRSNLRDPSNQLNSLRNLNHNMNESNSLRNLTHLNESNPLNPSNPSTPSNPSNPSAHSSPCGSPLLLYSTSDPLPQGISLDPYEGTLSGYPTRVQPAQQIRVVLTLRYDDDDGSNGVNNGCRQEDYATTVTLSIIGSAARAQG